MNTALEFVSQHWLAGTTGILGWGIGFFTDLGKEKWKRNLQACEDHALLVQKEILTPIYEYLNSFYLPVCQRKIGPLDVISQAEKSEPKHIAERSEDRARYQIRAKHQRPMPPNMWRFWTNELSSIEPRHSERRVKPWKRN